MKLLAILFVLVLAAHGGDGEISLRQEGMARPTGRLPLNLEDEGKGAAFFPQPLAWVGHSLQVGAAKLDAGVKAAATSGRSAAEEPGFLRLLSDEALPRWRQCGPGRFVVTNGVATGEGGMGLWWYAGRQFTNFVLRGEFVQEQDLADSGVFLRFPDPGQDPWVAVHQGHEMEIGDPAPKDPTWRTGSIYPFAASAKANTKPRGQWNAYEITCDGQEYTVRINGEVVTRWTDPKARTAHGWDWGPSGVDVAFHDNAELETYCKEPGKYDWVGGASYVAECLLTGKSSLITPEHGLHVLEVMNACHESQRTGRRVNIETTFKWPLFG